MFASGGGEVKNGMESAKKDLAIYLGDGTWVKQKNRTVERWQKTKEIV